MQEITQRAAALLDQVRKSCPLIHNITNYVTVNDVANATLALGASPIMADDIGEAADITAISKALVLNIGTLNSRTVESMLAAGKRANQLGIPVVLDPVGAGASVLRNRTVEELLKGVELAVLRGNLSEISFAAGLSVSTKGVDSAEEDEKNDPAEIARSVARSLGCTVAITGKVDTVSDGENLVRIENGHAMLSKVTGTGCMTSALVGACVGAGGDGLTAAALGVAAMGIAGELAWQAAGSAGSGSFHIAIIDALSRMTGKTIEERARYR